MKSILLIGQRASGKSTVGHLLARELGLGFIDTDAMLIQNRNMSIRELYQIYGEERFRAQEADLLRSLPLYGQVVATGGGMPMNPFSYRALLRFQYRIYLRVAPSVLLRRRERCQRPILEGYTSIQEEVAGTYGLRAEVYQSLANISYDQGEDTLEQTVQNLMALLK